MVRTCSNSHILSACFSSNLRANQWYWTNTCWCLGCTTWVALSQFVYCQVVWLQLPAWSMAVRWCELRTCINSYILTAWLSSNLRANQWYWTNYCSYVSGYSVCARYPYCTVRCIMRTHPKVHTCWWMGCIQRCFFPKTTFVIYWSFIIIIHIVVYLQNIETDRCFFWLVSIFYLHQFLPTVMQTSDIVQTNLQMHQVSDTYRPMLKCSFILCMILNCTIYIYLC